MKQNRKRNVLWLIAIIVLAAMTGCQNGKLDNSLDSKEYNDLKVVTQVDSAFNSNNEIAAFSVDVPVNGPQAIVDSVVAFINKAVYDACEDCIHFDEETKSFNPEEVFTSDGKQLLSHYMERYKGLIQDSLWKSFFQLSLKTETQTGKYVTYSMEQYHCGASCGSELYYYTFDKRDGHQIGEVISHDNLIRFFEDHPERATIEDLVDNYDWTFDPNMYFENSKFGLLDDQFIIVIEGFGNHYFTTEIPREIISSYLTPEAQALVEKGK